MMMVCRSTTLIQFKSTHNLHVLHQNKIDEVTDLIERCEKGILCRHSNSDNADLFSGNFSQSPAYILLQCYNFIQVITAMDEVLLEKLEMVLKVNK